MVPGCKTDDTSGISDRHEPGIVTFADGGCLPVVERKETEQLPDSKQTLDVIVKGTMSNT